jgi:hypothetical protein
MGTGNHITQPNFSTTMSKTYFFLLRWLPTPIAKLVLTLWYLFLMLAILSHLAYPTSGFIYWDG